MLLYIHFTLGHCQYKRNFTYQHDFSNRLDNKGSLKITLTNNYCTKIIQTRIYRTFVVFYVEKITTIEVLCEVREFYTIMCMMPSWQYIQAYRQERVYSAGYAWVIVGVDVDELLNTSTDMLLSVNCTLDMIKTVLNYTLVVESAMTEVALS